MTVLGLIWLGKDEISAEENKILQRCKKSKIYKFLRENRAKIFDEELQHLLASAYGPFPRGKKRVPPAQLAMALLLQAAFNVADHEVCELTLDSRRWQMVLGCLGQTECPLFSQGTLFNFRQRMIAKDLDKRLFEKTISLSKESGAFSSTYLRAAFDSCPLYGAGRVEDTFNLIGRAAFEILRTAAEKKRTDVSTLAEESGMPLLNASSIKAGLDMDWDQPKAREVALRILLGQVDALRRWLETELSAALEVPPLSDKYQTLLRLIEQDTEPDPDGSGLRLKNGVAKDRQISIHDPDMRHGRKTKHKRINGYKRHVAIQTGADPFVLAVALTPANAPERNASENLLQDIEAQVFRLETLDIDRGYLGAAPIEDRRRDGLKVNAKPFPLRNRGRYTKENFQLDLKSKTARCPAGITQPYSGQTVRFPSLSCDVCSQRSACTRAKSGRGRTLTLHDSEAFFIELRKIKRTPEGRAELRQRVSVEHAQARIANRRGTRARYRSHRKNLFDLRRDAALSNIQILAQFKKPQAA